MTFPQGAADLMESERGVFCVAALLIATILVVLKFLPGTTWIDFAKYLVGVLVASKTMTGAIDQFRRQNETAR